MASLAVILGIVAISIALATRSKLARQQKQIDRIKSQLFKAQHKSPTPIAPPVPPVQHDRPTSDHRQDRSAAFSTNTIAPPPAPPEPTPPVPDPTPVKDSDSLTPQAPVSRPSKDKALERLLAHNASVGQTNHDFAPGINETNTDTPKTKAKAVSLEERLGAGVYVWAGGVALMLAGAFLVKYSFDNDLLSVQARLALVGAFGAALVVASLWVRSRADKVAASICGAGVADLFATVLAATAYYEVINPWLGFALMALVTATAVGMSLKHGPFVALLGLVGGFVTPTLINGAESAWWPTFTYLLLLEIGLTVITRRRQWFGLSALTLVMSVLSALVYAVFSWSADSRGGLIFFVMGTAVVFILNATRSEGQKPSGTASPLRQISLGLGALGSSTLLLGLLVARSGFSWQELSAMGILGAGSLLLARLDKRYITLAFLAEGLCGMMLLAWPLAFEFADALFEPTQFFLIAIGYGIVFAVGGFLCLWRNKRPAVFAWLSVIGAMAFTLIAHIGGERFLGHGLQWWMVYTAVGAILTVATRLVWCGRKIHENRIIDIYALSAAAMATLAIWFGLDHPWVAVAWAGLAVAITALDRGLRLPNLLIATGWLTAGCALLLIVPGPSRYTMPMPLIANTMLAHYGLPTLCFTAIAWMFHRHTWSNVRDTFQALALATATITVSLQIRLAFHRDDLWTNTAGLIEWASYVLLWLAISFGALKYFKSAALEGIQKAATAIGVIGLAAATLYLLLHANPLLMQTDLGEMLILNWLLYAYGLPCVLALAVASVMPQRAGVFKQIAAGISFVLLFALVILEVRHGFVGSDMLLRNSPRVGLIEWSTYSVVLTLLSLAMSWIGWRFKMPKITLPATLFGLAGLGAVVLGPVMLHNPLFHTADVGGWRGLNWLIYIYGFPCLLAAVLAYTTREKLLPMKQIAVVVSLLLLFALVSFEIRQGFVGPNMLLDTHPISSAENYSYSLAWVLLALALLAGGLVTGSAAIRYGSLAVMLVAIGKVSLDTAQLRDLWRVLSLLGLGLSLIVLGYVYQRYVFRRPKAPEAKQKFELK
jgi:uncharacterized membrane protein